MSDYTPNVEDVRACYCRCRVSTERDITADIHKGRAEFDRFIAKVKADALREAAKDMRAQVERATEHQRFTEHELIEHGIEHVLDEYADRIEGEA